jgi:hypothetical protein
MKPRPRRLPPPFPREAKRSRGEGSGVGGSFLPAQPPHPGAFGADPPHRSQELAGGGWTAPLVPMANDKVLR